MSTTAVYHWWDYSDAYTGVAKNLHSPLILSIATLRASNSDIPIIVLYSGDRDTTEFEPFSNTLNFKVIPIKCVLQKYSHLNGWRYLSRIFDIHENRKFIETDVLMYCDADTFWIKNPLPHFAQTSKFCFDGSNSGFFYFNCNSKGYENFYEKFYSYTISALNSIEIRDIIRKHAPYKSDHYLFDEEILAFMLDSHSDLFDKASIREHCRVHTMDLVDIKRIKMFHATGIDIKNSFGKSQLNRGLLCLLLKELHEKIINMIDLNEIFTIEEIQHYLPQQFSFINEPNRIKGMLIAQ